MNNEIINQVQGSIISGLCNKLKDNRLLGILIVSIGVAITLSDNKENVINEEEEK